MSMTIHSSINARILEAQSKASKGINTPAEILKGLDKQVERKENGGSYLGERIWVPVYRSLRTLIMNEGHATNYFVHPRADKMYYDLRDLYWWPRMKMDISMYETTDKIVKIKERLRTARDRQKSYADHRRKPLEFSVGDKVLLKVSPRKGVETTDKIVKIKERLRTARDRQKSYADHRRKPLEFSVGDKVLLKVSPRKGVVRFDKRGKLTPRYVGPFEIVERKWLADVNSHLPLEEVKIDDKMHFVEEPMKIMDREVKNLKKRRIPIVKVHWNSRREPEFTWEREDEMKRKYPQLFACYDLGRATKISGRNSL
nr:putative reverse transcriptase domain-containing protein [Tanacetum cinerariifolium]